MSKEVMKASSKEVAKNEAENLEEWGEVSIDSSDIVIPKLILMQGQSTFVTDGIASFGDVVETPSKQVVLQASKGGVIELIPFHHTAVWSKYKVTNGKQEFIGYEDVVKGVDKEYEENHGSYMVKNMRTLNMFFINPKAPELPVVISFKGISQRTGKEIITQMYIKNRQAGKTPASYVLSLGAVKQKNDKGTFYVWEFKVSRQSTGDEVGLCLKWLKSIKTTPSAFKVDTTTEEETQAETVQTNF